ncbi:Saccharopine dehydrogenase-domain-containing protein [Flagelloscypha sp. PMI_526]|nr:Saccharopine dehydrogenase-domain-containing protein [Flagelloscypha sp. PMI_526]
MTSTVDILVLGSTGLTGRLIVRYLLQHPEYNGFALGVHGRDKVKVQNMLDGLGIDIPVPPAIFIVDITDQGQLDDAVSKTKVVINACGPYWTLGDPVIAACIKHKRHYLDLAGDIFWIRRLIQEKKEAAKAAEIYIVHCCAFDSLPSELGPYLANKTLKAFSSDAQLGESVSVFRMMGGISSGTLNSMMAAVENVPKDIIKEATQDFSISPVKGKPYPRPQLWYKTRDPETSQNKIGMFFPMSQVNKYLVQRDWGLFEQDENLSLHYGPDFVYDEFVETKSRILSVLVTVPLALFVLAVAHSQLIRNAVRKIVPDGIWLQDERLEKGWFKITNITKSAAPEGKNPHTVKTVLKGKGDPGYLCTAVMIAEGALIALKGEGTGKWGLSSTMPAFGDRIVERLKNTGRFEFESRIIQT